MSKFERIADFMQLYKKELENKQKWGIIESWRYSKFVALSEDLQSVTGIMVSHTTLIRIFQKEEFKRSPQQATLNALAKYIGYPNWKAFCYENIQQLPYRHEEEETDKIQPLKAKTPNPRDIPAQKRGNRISKKWLLTLGVILITALSLALGYFTQPSDLQEEIYFECKKTTGTYPYRFTFSYKVPKEGYNIYFKTQSFAPYLNNAVDSKRLLTLNPNDTIAYSEILMPDHYWAELVKDGETIRSIPIKVVTEDWISIVFPYARTKNERLRYEQIACQVEKNAQGFLTLPSTLKKKIQNDLLENSYEVNFFKVQEYGVDANNLKFKAKFNIGYVETKRACRYIRTTLLTTHGIIEIPLSDEGCPNHNKVWFGGYHASYKKQDMSKYQKHNLGQETIEINTNEGHGEVYLNGVLLESVNYEMPLGDLIGLRFKFEGWAELDLIEIKTQQGEMVYQSDFSPNRDASQDSLFAMD